MATFIADRFWEIPMPDRFMAENSFFEHLGLVGGFLLVAWHDRADRFQGAGVGTDRHARSWRAAT
jgi:hypothetical protein